MYRHPVLRTVLLVLSAAFVVVTALPLIREPYWWIRIFDFPRAQFVVVGLVTLGLVLFLLERRRWWDRVVVGLVVLSVGYQLWRIWPYTPLHGEQSVQAEAPEAARSFRLVVSNVLQTNRESEQWLRVVQAADPDVVVLLEANTWWQRAVQPLRRELPHAVEHPLDNTYGILVYSRWPLRDAEVREVVEDRIPSVWGSFELPSGDAVAFAFIHPRPPRPDSDTDNRDAELVLVAREVAEHDGPLIVAGDFNDVAWSFTTNLFQDLSGLLDPRIGRGLYATFPADWPPLRYPLDHVFHSESLALVETRVLGRVGSDHLPLFAEFAVVPRAEAVQDEPEAGAEDREAAEEIMEEQQDGE